MGDEASVVGNNKHFILMLDIYAAEKGHCNSENYTSHGSRCTQALWAFEPFIHSERDDGDSVELQKQGYPPDDAYMNSKTKKFYINTQDRRSMR